MDDQIAAVPNDSDGANIGDEVNEGHIDRLQSCGTSRQIEPIVILLIKPLNFGIFLGEGFDDACAAQVLLQAGGEDS